MPLLETKGLCRYFGGLKALDNLAMEVRAGEILGLIGPNGAGKSTCFNLLSGTMSPSAGTTTFDGTIISGLPAHRIARMGLVRTFQGITLFPELTVLENVMIGADRHFDWKIWEAILGSARYNRLMKQCRDRAMEILGLCALSELWSVEARNLPHGTQRILELAIALAAGPRLLLLDEPFSGLSTGEVQPIMNLIRQVRDNGVTIVLVEHHVKVVMSLCDRIVVLNYGLKVAEGTPTEVRSNPEVIKVYLGERRQFQAQG